ncbi:hypothetical protein AB4144_23395, partial [Rhizobiaceae sp. 2RAB30]
DTYDHLTNPNKAFFGSVGDGHAFLGYKLLPGRYPPAETACKNLANKVHLLIKNGQASIDKALSGRALNGHDRCYAQTLVAIDQTLQGWRKSFQITNCPETFDSLDRQIDRRLDDFRRFYLDKTARLTSTQRRKAVRVHLLSD